MKCGKCGGPQRGEASVCGKCVKAIKAKHMALYGKVLYGKRAKA